MFREMSDEEVEEESVLSDSIVVPAAGGDSRADPGLRMGYAVGLSAAAARVRSNRARQLERVLRVSSGPPSRFLTHANRANHRLL
eukprot:COSAG06_NODE_2593_length_6607_cov_2.577904_7_plen_85_part_00